MDDNIVFFIIPTSNKPVKIAYENLPLTEEEYIIELITLINKITAKKEATL